MTIYNTRAFYCPVMNVFLFKRHYYRSTSFTFRAFFHFTHSSFLCYTEHFIAPHPQLHFTTTSRAKSRCASTGLVNKHGFKTECLSVNAPTGHTSITFPMKSFPMLPIVLFYQSQHSHLSRIPCTTLFVSWSLINTQR